MKKGYKAFDTGMTCRGFQYEVGKTYTHTGEVELCNGGFHFCESAADIFEYYKFNEEESEVCRINAYDTKGSKIISGDNKSVCAKIKVVEKLTWQQVLVEVNQGKNNTGRSNSGYSNSGDWNSGNRNSGDWNSGDSNSGDSNSGNSNSGYMNSGDCNSGNRNSGDRNSGDRNSGYSNSGDWNSGDWNSGIFCAEKNPKIKIFDMDSDCTIKEWQNSEARDVLYCNFNLTEWVCESDMSKKEKTDNPKFYVAGGYLKTRTYKEAFAEMWGKLDKSQRKTVQELPNFDADKFEEITGVRINGR